ncbi:MAG: intradiol ring-cleavage dioxygenase [Burkholderiales bacterium]
MRRDRRRALGAGLAALVASAIARAEALRATPSNALGPFYPPAKPADSDADLTRIAGRAERARGTVLVVTGRIVDTKGRPIEGAKIELWQANAFGRYHHPSDTDASGPIDPGFQGYGALRSASDGSFRVVTIKPPPYGGRTPHIHFIVAGNDTRLTTQMFFEGEARNERDSLYRSLSGDDRRASTSRFVDAGAGAPPGAVAVAWDVVLPAA